MQVKYHYIAAINLKQAYNQKCHGTATSAPDAVRPSTLVNRSAWALTHKIYKRNTGTYEEDENEGGPTRNEQDVHPRG